MLCVCDSCIMYWLSYIEGLCCVEIIFVWELCNVEKLHCMWDCIVCVRILFYKIIVLHLGDMLYMRLCWLLGLSCV